MFVENATLGAVHSWQSQHVHVDPEFRWFPWLREGFGEWHGRQWFTVRRAQLERCGLWEELAMLRLGVSTGAVASDFFDRRSEFLLSEIDRNS